ncbi:MAG: hypothetical protein IPQ15_14390 [Betaproteobacteria bacterium]|nr:hypothetical protein [Betaproteobacteria bacterium]
MNDGDVAHAIAALSSRVNALEGALHALVCGGTFNHQRTLAVFDKFSQETLDRYSGLPVDDKTIELFEESFRDVRQLLSP